jgi:hypothetical protein
MGTTLLAKKANGEVPLAKSDDHHDVLASDPTVSSFPQGSDFGGNGFSSVNAAPAAPITNFGETSMPTTGFGAAQTPVTSQPMYNTKAGENAAQGADVLVANDNTDWINKKWRPVMGWMYMMTCTADFVVFPVLWSILQALSHGQVTSQWQPLTLQGAGLYHLAMGAVLGIAAYGRTKEKVAGAA